MGKTKEKNNVLTSIF